MTPEQLSAIADPHALRDAALAMVEQQLALIASQQAQAVAREAALYEQSAAHARTVESQQRELDINAGELKNKQLKIDALTAEIARLKRLHYGAKTEALSAIQHSLFGDAVDEDSGALEQLLEQTQSSETPSSPTPRAKSTPKREALPEHLPRVITLHEPDHCACAICTGPLVKIGEHASEKLGFKPAEFYVERHVYPQFACRACETVVAEKVAPAIIDRGIPAPSLLAQVVIAKFADHLPLYRQQAIYARAGLELPRSTLAEWVGAVGVALQPLVDRLRSLLLQQRCLHADETPVDELDPGTGKTHQSYLFAYRSTAGPPMVVFDYAISRSGKHARHFLGDWRGALMVDDYAGYKALFKDGVTELACWVHVRRKFVEVVKASGSPIAQQAVERIAALYRIESEAKEQELAGEALAAYRLQHAQPVLTEMHTWLQDLSMKTLKNSALNKAVNHALSRWPALLRYLGDCGHPIDNNPIENAIRPITLGRKNWLFVGATRAGERAAAIMSLLATAKANHLCPHAWMSEVLTRLPTTLDRDIDGLLPIEGWKSVKG